ncbi:MAG: HEAT repeat domain-containing protein [Candidatus Acidiferrales bacterium]
MSKLQKETAWTLILFVFTSVLFIASFPIQAAQQTSLSPRQTADLLAALHSKEWLGRAHAYYQLIDNSSAMHQETTKSALIDLLNRENSSDPSEGRDYKPDDGEEYAEYIGSLVGTVAEVADWKNSSQVCIIAHSPFDPDSALAARLARTGQTVIPCLLEMAKNGSWTDRYQAVAVLIQVRATVRELSANTSEEIRDATIRALHDTHEMVRIGTVHALGRFGGTDMIPALQKVAQTDPSPEVQGRSIRKAAASAIAAIQKRAAQPNT